MKKLRLNSEGKMKLFLSLALFAYSVYVTFASKNMGAWYAMLLSTFGDIAIMASRGALTGKRERTFNIGVVFFSFAHLAYVGAMFNNEITVVIAVISFIAVALITWFQPRGKTWNFIPYAIALLNSAVNAWLFSWVAGVGMILFLASDLILSICEEKSPKWQIAIWATYVPAQVFMLTAILIK